MRRLPISTLLVAAALVAGCGGSSTPTSDTTPTTPTTTAGPAPTDTTNAPPKVVLVDGVYTAPDGAFTFRPDPGWDSADVGGEIYFATNAERTDTITVVGEGLDGAPAELADYVSVSLESAPDEIDGFRLLSRRTVTLPSGDAAERIEYAGTVDGSPPMRFLTLVSLSATTAVTATFAAPRTRFDGAVDAIEPVLRTIDVG